MPAGPLTAFQKRLHRHRVLLLLLLAVLVIVWLARSEPDHNVFANPDFTGHLLRRARPADVYTAASAQASGSRSCAFPVYVVRRKDHPNGDLYGEFDQHDPTARARVGPNPQLHSSANFTVIYNFASPEPSPSAYKIVERSANETANEEYEERSAEEEEEEEEDEVEEVTDEDHVTLATHATPEFVLPNLLRLLDHWPQDPISLSIYAPGEDFCQATAVVSWLWTCRPQVRRQVSFHVFFPADFANDIAAKTASEGIRILDVDCAVEPVPPKRSFRKERHLPYPVNTARNVARTAARTKYLLTSDVELYPSPNLAKNFIDFVKSPQGAKLVTGDSGGSASKVVFVVPTFEIEEGVDFFPQNKRQLVDLYRRGKVVHFHKYSCNVCQKFPGLEEWSKSADGNNNNDPDESVSVFRLAQRRQQLNRWEPIYVGTQAEPLYDERLSWEGFQDKMTQAHELCLLDYHFAVLDTAFLIHRPGVKRRTQVDLLEKEERERRVFVEQNRAVYKSVVKELQEKYGTSKNCKAY